MPEIPDDDGVRILSEYAPRKNGHDKAALRVLSKADFVATFQPPEYLIDGMLQRGYIYALTGTTGHAKSAIALLIAELMGSPDRNAMFGNHKVEKGRVLYFVGENPTDICMRVIGADSQRPIEDEPLRDRIFYIVGRVEISKIFEPIKAAVEQLGGVDLVIVDTSASYFYGDDEVSNTQMGAHARTLRGLTELPGRPCVLVLCHPIKRPLEPEQLLPRGGGAFLAEVDGNLTCWKKDELIELHWTGKMRGPGFEPLSIQMDVILTSRLIDAKNRLLPTVRAVVVGNSEEEQQADKLRDDEDQVLIQMTKWPGQPLRSMASALNWTNDKGEPLFKRVHRAIERLAKETPKLVKKTRDVWEVTEEGKKAAAKADLKNATQLADNNQESLL